MVADKRRIGAPAATQVAVNQSDTAPSLMSRAMQEAVRGCKTSKLDKDRIDPWTATLALVFCCGYGVVVTARTHALSLSYDDTDGRRK